MRIDSKKIWPYSIYKYYTYCGLEFDRISIYKYLWSVFIIKQFQKERDDNIIENSYI